MNKGAQIDECKTPAHHTKIMREESKTVIINNDNTIKSAFRDTCLGWKWWIQR
jgi:hypothetical protein